MLYDLLKMFTYIPQKKKHNKLICSNLLLLRFFFGTVYDKLLTRNIEPNQFLHECLCNKDKQLQTDTLNVLCSIPLDSMVKRSCKIECYGNKMHQIVKDMMLFQCLQPNQVCCEKHLYPFSSCLFLDIGLDFFRNIGSRVH